MVCPVTASEAPLRSTKFGLVADVDGWFVLNARDSRWRDYGPLGAVCDFEGKRPFRQLGINLNILMPGEPMSMYHRESHQEGFLVLAGACLLVVEGEERQLRVWEGIVYLVDDVAKGRGAGVEVETTKSAVAYARFPGARRSTYRDGWLPDDLRS